jgi:hypothetical protein
MPAKKRQNEKGFPEHYLIGLRSSTKHNTAAYGYSIAAGSTLAAMTDVDGAPSLLDIFVFIAGTSVAFAAINIVSTAAFRARMPSEPPVVVALGTTFSMISISVAVASAVGIAYALQSWIAWGVGALTFTLVYLLLLGLELGLAARAHPRGARDGEATNGGSSD